MGGAMPFIKATYRPSIIHRYFSAGYFRVIKVYTNLESLGPNKEARKTGVKEIIA